MSQYLVLSHIDVQNAKQLEVTVIGPVSIETARQLAAGVH